MSVFYINLCNDLSSVIMNADLQRILAGNRNVGGEYRWEEGDSVYVCVCCFVRKSRRRSAECEYILPN